MRIIKKSLVEVTQHMNCRMDYKYWNTMELIKLDSYVLLKDMFDIVNGSVQTSNYVQHKTNKPYIRVGDIDFKFGIRTDNVIFLDEATYISEEKILKKNDLILAKIGTVGKIGLVENVIGGTHSNNTVVLRPKNKNINMKFYEKLFQTDYFINYIYGIASQKAQPNLQPYELENIKIPVIERGKQRECMAVVRGLEEKISEIQNKIKSEKEIIDDVFKEKFNIDYESMKKIDSTKIFNANFCELDTRNTILRNSVRWNKAIELQNCMKKTGLKCVKLGQYILETKNGWSPSCSGSGDYQVLGIDAIRLNGKLSFENPKFSSETKSTLSDYFIRNGDFFVSRGNTVDLVSMASVATVDNDDPPTIFPDLMIRVKFSEDIDVRYMAYVFNSFIGRMYFKYSTKGKNQTMVKVSPLELHEFVVPLPGFEEQQRIVEHIDNKVNSQLDLFREIESYRKRIDRIILSTFLDE